jgi:beta-lactam-binding protein with PASTA domain
MDGWRTLAIAAVVCIALAGCGTKEVPVPNVIGEQADPAVRSIEDANLTVKLNPQPADRSLCTVTDQSETGKVAEDTEVTLDLTCQVVVPTVTGQSARQARDAIKAAGDVTVSFEGGSPRNYDACSVVSQDKSGEVDPGTRVTLVYTCPLTMESLQSDAQKLAAENDPTDPFESYEVSGCRIISHDEGSCDVTYIYPDGGICSADIVVTLNEDATVANTEEQNKTCS